MSAVETEESKRWRLLALEALTIAEQMSNPETKAIMLDIAVGYDRLAEHAEKHARILREVAEITDPSPGEC